MQFGVLGAALLLSFGVGCGGVVVVDDGSNSGGAGGAGGANPSGPVGPGSTSSGIQDVCEAFCALPGACFGDPTTCRSSCEGLFVPGCDKETTAFIECITRLTDPNSCTTPLDACAFEADAYVECTEGSPSQCVTDECSGGSDGDCYCSGSCAGSFGEVKCSVMEGGSLCSCVLDGAFFGECQEFSANACALETSCCNELFFGIEPQPG